MGSLVRPVWPWVTVLSRLLRCPAWASATPERVAALQRKHPLAYRPRMRRGKLDDRAAHCGDFGMGLFIRGRYAGLWRVGVPEPAPHGATVVLQLNQLLIHQHTRDDRGTERLSLHGRVRAGEPEDRRRSRGVRRLRCEPQLFQELLDHTESHAHTRSSS